MKLSESVMTILMIVLGILPFIWFTYLGKKVSGKSKNIINDLLKKEDFNFNQKELWNHNFIGIDEVKNKLLFIKLSSGENSIERINLNEVKSCQINKTTRDYKREKKMESELQTLSLELTFIVGKPKMILNFYDINDSLSEDFEMKRAEKWQQIILQNIAKSKTASIAA